MNLYEVGWQNCQNKLLLRDHHPFKLKFLLCLCTY
jgi:hypothetical protein